MKRYSILLLSGGDSPERDVSLESGRSIFGAIEALGHRVRVVDPGRPELSGIEAPEAVFGGAAIGEEPPLAGDNVFEARTEFLEFLIEWKESGGDIVFNALHGGAGEDGTLQALLEYLAIPFTGSGALSCALAMNKALAKRLAADAGVPVVPGFLLRRGEEELDTLKNRIQRELPLPVIVKPNNQGSSVGFSIVRNIGDLEGAVDGVATFGDSFLVEAYIDGFEITASILDDEVLPLIEVKPRSGVYDYRHKYTPGASEYIVPARLGRGVADTVADAALKAFRTLGCSVYGRADFRLSRDGQPFFLEMNTLPGMTANSLVPKAARAAGVEFPELVDRILRLSLSGGAAVL